MGIKISQMRILWLPFPAVDVVGVGDRCCFFSFLPRPSGIVDWHHAGFGLA